MRKVTVFVEHVFPLTTREGEACELELRVLEKTSSKGHKVNIRQLTVERRRGRRVVVSVVAQGAVAARDMSRMAAERNMPAWACMCGVWCL